MTDVLIVSTALEDTVSVVFRVTTASEAVLFVTVAFEAVLFVTVAFEAVLFVTVASEAVLFVTMTFGVVLLSPTVLRAKVSDTFFTFERRGYFPW